MRSTDHMTTSEIDGDWKTEPQNPASTDPQQGVLGDGHSARCACNELAATDGVTLATNGENLGTPNHRITSSDSQEAGTEALPASPSRAALEVIARLSGQAGRRRATAEVDEHECRLRAKSAPPLLKRRAWRVRQDAAESLGTASAGRQRTTRQTAVIDAAYLRVVLGQANGGKDRATAYSERKRLNLHRAGGNPVFSCFGVYPGILQQRSRLHAREHPVASELDASPNGRSFGNASDRTYFPVRENRAECSLMFVTCA
jgi:hypothetical protein